jgi:uncharacterized protein
LLGLWSYEAVDTKLARETRGGTILQLSLYSELIRTAQGASPEFFHVVTPDSVAPVQSFRVDDFGAYFRLISGRLAAITLEDPKTIEAANYPEPVEYCNSCRWWAACDRRRRDDDHLCLTAGISRLQTRELQFAGVATLAKLAASPLPLPFTPRRGAEDTYVRVHEQARVQAAGRTAGRPIHEILSVTPEHGFCRLPAPSAGDVFLDLEGDPFAREGGREYLFGLVITEAGGGEAYRSLWAISDSEEKDAFEATVDAIQTAWAKDPAMHVYHYASYEPSALRRLMGRHATRESEIDGMLRAGLFVDLHAIVKRSLRASVEKYSIKDLEIFYGFRRSVALEVAGPHLRVVDRALELGAVEAISAEVRSTVEGYNRDDCLSAMRLRHWLEELRAAEETRGTSLTRPAKGQGEASEEVSERERRARELGKQLLVSVSTDRAQRDAEQQARWLLASLLSWHRREEKAPWWEFFRLSELTEDELLDERAAIAGMHFLERQAGTARNPIDRFSYPLQEAEIDQGDSLRLPPDGVPFGKVAAHDRTRRILDVKKHRDRVDAFPTAAFKFEIVSGQVMEDSISRIAEDVIRHGVAGGTRYRAGRRLLLAEPPRLRSGPFSRLPGESALLFARRIADQLDETVLAIQGPPGSGKTYTGAAMICDLVRAGRRVGITAVSHKVIRNLLDATVKEARVRGMEIRCAQKVTDKGHDHSVVTELGDNAEALANLQEGGAHVLGGTSWLWARPEFLSSVDVLFVDEAGQMSLANVVAVSQAAASVVLLGDPQQLEQPLQGSHPEGTDVSALEHVIQGRKTIADDRGIFLPETRRLAPKICEFTSELFYESRLKPLLGLERQQLVGTGLLEGSGLWLVQVEHDGNQNSSPEEVVTIGRIVSVLLADGGQWVDCEGEKSPLSGADILVVAPYNAQVVRLAEALEPRGVRVGTVDKFQGQEAPVVIYSMATSSPEDAPRGMEFLYSPNRLNVATSRARCACILVASPRLLEPECKTPRQMQLANALCRYAELARIVDLS